MSQKKKGFTLVEVIVVMLVATLVFTMVGGTMVFVTTTTGDLIQQAEDIEMAKNIERYLRQCYEDNPDFLTIPGEDDSEKSKYLFDEDEFFPDSNLDEFEIYQYKTDNFIRCYMKFKTGRQFDFIIGAK